MVGGQLAVNRIDNEPLLAAFLWLPRHLFMPSRLRVRAYGDCSIPLEVGGRVMPSPLIVARLLEAVLPDGDLPLDGKKVLTAAAGSGYCTSLVRLLGGEADYAEGEAELVVGMRASFAACSAAGYGIGELPQIINPMRGGERYDYIIIEASVDEPPQYFRRLLKPNGKLVAIRRNDGLSAIGDGFGETLGELAIFTPNGMGFSHQDGGEQGWLPPYVAGPSG